MLWKTFFFEVTTQCLNQTPEAIAEIFCSDTEYQKTEYFDQSD